LGEGSLPPRAEFDGRMPEIERLAGSWFRHAAIFVSAEDG